MYNLINRLQWKHLRLIQTIHQSGQLSVAAQRLALSQPAASRMLAEIETELGQPLFERNPKGMVPTPIGTVFIRNASSLLEGLSATVKEITAFSEGTTGSVSVGAVTGAAVAYVVPAISALKKEARNADVNISVAPSETLIQGLINGEHDFVLSRIPPEQDTRQFEVRKGRIENVEFLMHADHDLAKLDKHDIADLAGYSWVIQASGMPIREAVEESYLAHNVPMPDDIVNTPSLLVMIAYLQSSNAISPVPSEVADLLLKTGAKGLVSIQLRQSIIISPYHVIQMKDRAITPIAHRMRDLVINALDTHSLVDIPTDARQS